jgi:hypothetical protein
MRQQLNYLKYRIKVANLLKNLTKRTHGISGSCLKSQMDVGYVDDRSNADQFTKS